MLGSEIAQCCTWSHLQGEGQKNTGIDEVVVALMGCKIEPILQIHEKEAIKTTGTWVTSP
jgi:hypothetical protein